MINLFTIIFFFIYYSFIVIFYKLRAQIEIVVVDDDDIVVVVVLFSYLFSFSLNVLFLSVVILIFIYCIWFTMLKKFEKPTRSINYFSVLVAAEARSVDDMSIFYAQLCAYLYSYRSLIKD